MRLIQWKQLDTEFRDAPAYTGSLSVTGSILLNDIDLSDIANYSIFRPTGSYYNTTNNIGITGSFQLAFNGVEDYFKITVAGTESLRVNTEGILQLSSQSQEPVAVRGGVYYSNTDEYFLGFL